jgi:ATP-dependent DNA ligase
MATLPFEPPVEPMLAQLRPEIPRGDAWVYEPKWDGFRAMVFYDGESAYIQSRDLKPLARYFPELQASLQDALPRPMVLDGEVVIVTNDGLDFDALQMRIHPAESRVRKLAAETPSSFVAFDMLAIDDRDLRGAAFSERRAELEKALAGVTTPVFVTPATSDYATAQRWFKEFEGAGLDGIVAKGSGDPYKPGVRAMVKIKHLREADCVVGGLRWYKGSGDQAVGSLLLGLYDDSGVLHHVGHTASFKAPERKELATMLRPLITEDEAEGFGSGRTPGGPSRWTGDKDLSWVRVRPELVCEVAFDHLQGDRFRHAATFRRWRSDKPARACTYEQLDAAVPFAVREIFDSIRG